MKTLEAKTKKKVRRKKPAPVVEDEKPAKKETDNRFKLDKFRGRSKKDSRGMSVKRTEVKGRDLTSAAAPKTLKDYYRQLEVDRGGAVPQEEEDHQEDLSSSDDDSVTEESDIWEEGLKPTQPDEESELLESATNRIALRNCDWDHLKASNLFALLQSFTPLGGTLLSVKIFISEYGKKQLPLEQTQGPDIWNKRGETDNDSQEGEEVEEAEEDNGLGEFVKEENSEESIDEMSDDLGFELDDPAIKNETTEEGERFSENKYRRYEMQRLRYYYAIATFDSAKTAAHVYSECDGTEIERSGTVFDLSFVPEDMTFSEHIDIATSVKSNFKANTNFVTNALQNSRFAISWDQVDPKRKRVIGSLFDTNDEDLNNDEINQYLAPPESSSEDEDVDREEKRRQIRSKYACLFEDIGGLTEQLPDDEDEGGEMEEMEEDYEEGEEDEEDEEGEEEEQSLLSDDADLVRQQLADLDSDPEQEEEQGRDLGVTGNLESTMNIGAKEGSKNLKDVLKVKADREGESIWERKLRRKKESRKQAKKDRAESRKAAEPEVVDKAESRRRLLKALDVEEPDRQEGGEDAPKRGKKDKRKAHKQAKVAAAAAERQAKRDKRLQAAGINVSNTKQDSEKTEPAAEIDPRFAKLLDHRFTIDKNHAKFKGAKEEKDLMQTVSAKRRSTTTHSKRKQETVAEESTGTGVDLASSVSFFKKRAKQG
eukprot:TRINITY_DN15195_c0_g1_i1.p1 TRINITY_DN15195_c0_g1~~TRINITY_DN15195_c0_g1_i1.p1  ORF type:complete len:710 (+),score=216.13 TRINITY_DN15195_c0_g1_i1:123-2252(+)